MADPYATFAKPVQEAPSAKQRTAAAGATKAEATAAVAPALTRAQLRAAELQAQEAEAKLAEREEEKAGEAAAKEAAAEASMGNREQALLLLQLIQRAKDAVSKAGATGITAQITGGLFGTPAINLDAALEPVRSSTVLSAMAEARKGSAVGATGFGALDRGERAMLASSKGSLSAAQSPENIIQSLENIDRLLRYGLSREAGYDPRSPEGAALFRLPMPESAKDLPLPSGGDIKAGRWDKKPELAGIDAAISSMIKSGRSAEQIRQYLNEYQPGLGDETENLEVNIDFWKATGRDPNVTVERFFVPEETGLIQEITDTPGGAGTQAALNQLSMGVSGLIPGETGQQIRAVQRGLAEKYPTATTIGNVLGGIGSAASGTALAGKLGLKLPGLLEGVVQEGFRGAAMAEPGERFGGAAEGSLTALGGNVLMKPVSSLAGNILRGATPDAATLSQKYDITLSPGQLSGVDEGTLAGLPLVGGQVQARRNESLDAFNRAAFKDALAPIGVDVGAVGQKGIASAQEAVSDAYDEALGGLILNLDQPMLQAIRGKPYAELGKLKDIGPELQRSVDEIFTKYADPQNGAISGGNLQAALIEIRQLENAYKQDPRWANRIKPALSEISDGYAGALERQAPENFELFKNANTAYRNLSVLEGAVLKAPDGDIFGPGNLRTATNQATNKFGGRKAAARGDKPFNELIQAATDIVPKKADEVSLAGRMFPAGAGAGVGVGGVTLLSSPSEETSGQGDGPSYIPPSLLAAGLGAGLASLPYSRGGTRLANVLMGGQRSENQRLLGDLIANYMTPAVRGAFIGATSEPGVPMPQEQVDPGLVVTPEMRAAVLGSPTVETGEPSEPLGGFKSEYTDVDALGRRIDPLTGLPIEEEEAAEGFKRGGMVKGYKGGGLLDYLPDAEDVTGFGRSVAEGAMFGYNDNAEALLRAPFDKEARKDELDRIRREQIKYKREHPVFAGIGEGVGTIGTALLPGMQGLSAARLARMGPKARAAYELALATGQGAAYGGGTMYDDPDSKRDPLAVFASETAGGMLSYPASRAAVAGGRALSRRVPQGAKDFVTRKGRELAGSLSVRRPTRR
jgi:hypothetical protein